MTYQNHSRPPTDITVLTSIKAWSDLPNFHEVLPVFIYTTIFISLTVGTHREFVSIFPMQRCHGVIEPDTFQVQSHSSLIPCYEGSLAFHIIYVPLSNLWDMKSHRWELPSNYPIFTVVMAIYHFFERIWIIIINPNFTV